MGIPVEDKICNNGAHVLVIPFINQGHITPMVRLATQLCRKGVTITFASPEESVAGLTSSDELKGLDFRFIALPKPEREPEDVRDGSTFMSGKLKEAFVPVTEQLLRHKRAGIAGPTSIISDVFFPWTQDVADRLQIPRYALVTEGAIFARFMQGLLPYYDSGKFQASDTGKLIPFDWSITIPGLPPLKYYQLPRSILEEPVEYRLRCASLEKSAGILVNSFLELEEHIFEQWNNLRQHEFPHLKVPKMIPVGPLFSTAVLNVRGPPRGLEDAASNCLRWLESQPAKSVLYVAFGSLFRLTAEQIYELAQGLEASGQRFLWVIPQLKGRENMETPTSIKAVLPKGFQQRLGDRCCVVTGWAPQLQILAHSSTKAFLTHSGWNSTLESIALGVPMISCPQGAEQHLNCGYLVDDLNVAEQLHTGPKNIMRRDEVERAVRLLMVGQEGKEIISRYNELHRKCTAAVAAGGSKSRMLEETLEELRKNKQSPSVEKRQAAMVRTKSGGVMNNIVRTTSMTTYMQEAF